MTTGSKRVTRSPVDRRKLSSSNASPPAKTYDREYFEHWYRHPRARVSTAASLARKVRMAVGMTEFLIGRPIRSVLDVGCGEAPWFPVLRRMRPDVRYIGIDSSEYAIQRYGKTRNIRRGTLDDLDTMRLPRVVDLVVCADVLQYVDRRGVERGLKAIRRLLGGVAYIEAFTTEDDMAGDHGGWHERSAVEYRELFATAGLTQCGPHCYADLDDMDYLITFERF
ncbi:MAG: methyltransferase [Gemmatimonadaceae bacterium]